MFYTLYPKGCVKNLWGPCAFSVDDPKMRDFDDATKDCSLYKHKPLFYESRPSCFGYKARLANYSWFLWRKLFVICVHPSILGLHILYLIIMSQCWDNNNNNNKSAQNNLGRRPRRCESLHVRRKVPIGYNGAPQIRHQKYPFPWTDLQTPLPASCLDSSDLWCQTASGSDAPFSHNALDRPTHWQTDKSSTGKSDD